MPNGKGRFINANDLTVYEGQWVNNEMHGQGCYTWRDGSTITGFFRKNRLNGFGKYISARGKQYEGQWIDNKKWGNGILTWPDGRKYEGQFIND